MVRFCSLFVQRKPEIIYIVRIFQWLNKHKCKKGDISGVRLPPNNDGQWKVPIVVQLCVRAFL